MNGSRFVCKNASNWSGKALGGGRHFRCGINITVYADESLTGEASLPWFDADLRLKTEEVHAAHNSSAQAACGVVFELESDGFGTTAETFQPNNERADQIREQVCDYVAEVQTSQHRRFFLTVSIYKTTTRLMRWDRVGAIISEPIDLGKEPEKLYEFLYRLKYATDLQLGLDPTARVIVKDIDNHPSVIAVNAALMSLPTSSRTTPFIKEAFSDKLWPYYELDVPDQGDPNTTHTFLVRNPSTNSAEATGRATKGYVAFDVGTNMFRFLKDSWRTDAQNVHPELEVYCRLKAAITPPVEGLASVCCGGDLKEPVYPASDAEVTYKSQATETQEFSGTNQYVYYPRVHTRIVLNEVGIPLKHYKDSKELCAAVMTAFYGESNALEYTRFAS